MQLAFLPADPLERFAYRVSNRYAIEREIGRGGSGLVLLARDLLHDRRVAIKLVHPELALTQAAERFRQEIRLTTSFRHPNILPLLDSGAAGDTLYCVMPYVAGGSLRERLDRDGQLPLAEAASVVRQVASALASAHAAGIVHRDIKPENLLLDGSHVYVTDFGIARVIDGLMDEGFTGTGMTIGTPAYMSPEQTEGGRGVDPRADVYSLGVVFYEMLTGVLPYPGGWVRSALFRHITPSAPSPVIRRPDLPRAIARLVLQAIAEHPDERFATANAMGEALERALLPSRRRGAEPGPLRWRRGLAAARALAGRLCGFA